MWKFRYNWTLIIAAILLFIFAASCSGKPDYPAVTAQGKNIIIDTSTMKEGVPVFYSFNYDAKRADFFVVIVNDGAEAYLDACMKCYPKKKGYRFVDGVLHCVACGETYWVKELKGAGSCHPIALDTHMEGDNLFISQAELVKGLKYF